jgi:outer membrane protein TolC
MKREFKLLLLIVLLYQQPALPQKIISLKDFYDMAKIASSLSGEKEAYNNIYKIKDENLSKGWLPTIDANGSFIYNSSVVDMGSSLGSLPIPGIASAIKPLPHEQYKITVDVNQVLYDGGAIKGARAIEKAELSINEKQTETDLYKLRGQINNYYFNILLLARQKELLKNYLELIKKRISSIQSAVINGVILKSDIDVMTSEKLKIEQQLTENEIRKNSLLKILSSLTGKEIDPVAEFVIPADNISLKAALRPEKRTAYCNPKSS